MRPFRKEETVGIHSRLQMPRTSPRAGRLRQPLVLMSCDCVSPPSSLQRLTQGLGCQLLGDQLA